jgi:hypothetical protein
MDRWKIRREITMRYAIKLCGGATVLGLALIASAWFFREHEPAEWVESGVYLALGTFYLFGLYALPKCVT